MGVLNDCEDYGFGLYGSFTVDMGRTFLERKNKPSRSRVKGGGTNPHESWHGRLNLRRAEAFAALAIAAPPHKPGARR
jgi:hypothetical protein